MSRATDTRRVYATEATWVTEEWPMARLRELAHDVWFSETKGLSAPQVVAGRGMRYGPRGLLSFCTGDRSRIVLARHQRDPKVLLHELVHAMGNMTHGKRFWSRLGELLRKYQIKVVVRV